MIKVNNKTINIELPVMLDRIIREYKPDADMAIVDGFGIVCNKWAKTPIKANAEIVLLNKSQTVSVDQFELLMSARHTPKVFDKLKRSTVAVAGLGGLGSNVANMLSRSGVGRLIIADFDIVDATNLNRQIYYIDQLGKSKTDATKENILRINPYTYIEDYNAKLNPTNIVSILNKVDAVAECFDLADQKQMIVETVLTELKDVPIFSASGMAGIGGSNMIKTKYVSNRHIICGDLETAAETGRGLMSPRVTIAAAHQANAIIKYLIDGKIEKDFDSLI